LSQQRLDSTALDPLFESRKGCEPFGCASAARRGLWVEHATPADRVAPLRIADNEALCAGRAHGSIEDELHAGRVPGRQARLLERHHVSQPMCGTQVHVHRRPGRELRLGPAEQMQADIEPRACDESP